MKTANTSVDRINDEWWWSQQWWHGDCDGDDDCDDAGNGGVGNGGVGDDADVDENGDYLHCIWDGQTHHSGPTHQLGFWNLYHDPEMAFKWETKTIAITKTVAITKTKNININLRLGPSTMSLRWHSRDSFFHKIRIDIWHLENKVTKMIASHSDGAGEGDGDGVLPQ